MAKLEITGFGEIDTQLSRLLDRSNRKRILEAGANATVEAMQTYTMVDRHIRTGSMLHSIDHGRYWENVEGSEISVFPVGYDEKGVPNALKAYVINYGRIDHARHQQEDKNYKRSRKHIAGSGYRVSGKKMGDKFITRRQRITEEYVRKAMQAESDSILDEINR